MKMGNLNQYKTNLILKFELSCFLLFCLVLHLRFKKMIKGISYFMVKVGAMELDYAKLVLWEWRSPVNHQKKY